MFEWVSWIRVFFLIKKISNVLHHGCHYFTPPSTFAVTMVISLLPSQKGETEELERYYHWHLVGRWWRNDCDVMKRMRGEAHSKNSFWLAHPLIYSFAFGLFIFFWFFFWWLVFFFFKGSEDKRRFNVVFLFLRKKSSICLFHDLQIIWGNNDIFSHVLVSVR